MWALFPWIWTFLRDLPGKRQCAGKVHAVWDEFRAVQERFFCTGFTSLCLSCLRRPFMKRNWASTKTLHRCRINIDTTSIKTTKPFWKSLWYTVCQHVMVISNATADSYKTLWAEIHHMKHVSSLLPSVQGISHEFVKVCVLGGHRLVFSFDYLAPVSHNSTVIKCCETCVFELWWNVVYRYVEGSSLAFRLRWEDYGSVQRPIQTTIPPFLGPLRL